MKPSAAPAAPAVKAFAWADNGGPVCSHCKPLGLTCRHPTELCYINPASGHYKPKIAERRMKYAKPQAVQPQQQQVLAA